MNGKMLKEKLIKTMFFLCALSSIAIVFFIVIFMLSIGYPIILEWFAYGFAGILGSLFGSLYVAFGGTLLGVAIGIPCAIYLSEFSNMKIRNMIKPTLEVLNGFPSVILGLLGYTLICTQLSRFGIYGTQGCTLVGWIVIGIMSLPLIASVSEDSIRAVPHDLKEASLGLGATKWQTTVNVLIPRAMPGILTAVLLAFANGIGETMAVIMVIGNVQPPPITLDPFKATNTITSLIAFGYQEVTTADKQYAVLFAAGILLFIVTALTNVAIRAITKRSSSKQ